MTNLSLSPSNAGPIIRQVLPPFPSDYKSNDVWTYGDEIFLTEEDARAAGSEPNDSTWTPSWVHFACGGHALHDKIARDQNSNADPALNLMMDTTRILTAKIRLREEVNGVAAIVTGMNGYITDQAGAPWNSADVDPYKYLRGWIDTVTQAGGTAPNRLAISQPLWTAVRTNPNVVGLITGAPQIENAQVTQAQFAQLLELDGIDVGKMVYKTSPAATKSFVWGEKALLYYRAPNPGLRVYGLGYTPLWTRALSAVSGLEKIPGMEGMGDQFVQQYYWEPDISDHVAVHSYFDQQIWMPQAGRLFTGCLGTANA